MGFAPYGEPRYCDVIRDNLIDLKPDGSFRLCAASRSPEDAFRCLMGIEIEILVIGNCILYKDGRNPNLIRCSNRRRFVWVNSQFGQ